MPPAIEDAIRNTLIGDGSIEIADVDRAIAIINGTSTHTIDLCRVVSYEDATNALGISRKTLKRYIKNGYLTRVIGLGGRAIGINGNSLDAFRQRRIVHKGKPIM